MNILIQPTLVIFAGIIETFVGRKYAEYFAVNFILVCSTTEIQMSNKLIFFFPPHSSLSLNLNLSLRLSSLPVSPWRVWWRAGRMSAGTIVISGGILAGVILLCIVAVLCYCRLQVSLCVYECVCVSVIWKKRIFVTKKKIKHYFNIKLYLDLLLGCL